MARRSTARQPADDGVIPVKDFAGAVRTWRNDIKPALSNSGEAMQEASTGYKHIKKNCRIQPQAAKLAFRLDGMEEARRDDFLRCFTGLLRELNIPLEPVDLVDAMHGGGERPKPQLVPVPSDGTETDLADAAGSGFTEATEAELAQQESRPPAA